MKRKIKIDKAQVMPIPDSVERGGFNFWREVLKACSDLDGPSASYTVLVDPSVEDSVNEMLTETLHKGYEFIEQEIQATIGQRVGQGAQRRSTWWGNLYPNWDALKHKLSHSLFQGCANSIQITYRRWMDSIDSHNQFHTSNLKGKREGAYLRVGKVNQVGLHIRGRVRIVIVPSIQVIDGHEPGEYIYISNLPASSFHRREGNSFSIFLKECSDEDIAVLYLEFPSCWEIQRELVARSQDFHIHEGLRPRLTWNKIGKIRNAELRRTLMTVGIVSGVPDPIAVDDEGELFDLDEFTRVLKLVCPSTGRIYHLGVPSSCSTPREARRWTLGLPEGAEIIAET